MFERIGLGIDDRVISTVKCGIFELGMAGQLAEQDKADDLHLHVDLLPC